MHHSPVQVCLTVKTDALPGGPVSGAVAFMFFRDVRPPGQSREYYLTRELRKRGIPVTWALPQGATVFWPDCAGATIARIPTRSPSHSIDMLAHPWRVAGVLARTGVTTVWLPGWGERYPMALLLLVLILTVRHMRVVYDPMDPILEYEGARHEPPSTYRPSLRDRILLTLSYWLCARVVVPTSHLCEAMRDHLPLRGNLVTAWWGSDAALFNATRRAPTAPHQPNTFTVGWLGTMNQYTGITEVMLPLNDMLQHRIPGIRLVIAGKGPLAEQVNQRASLNGQNISFRGELPYDQAPAFVASLDLLVVPTRPDVWLGDHIWPIKLFDALLMGVPVLTTRTRATEHLARELPALQTCDWSPQAFADAIVHIYQLYPQVLASAAASMPEAGKHSHQQVSIHLAKMLSSITPNAR